MFLSDPKDPTGLVSIAAELKVSVQILHVCVYCTVLLNSYIFSLYAGPGLEGWSLVHAAKLLSSEVVRCRVEGLPQRSEISKYSVSELGHYKKNAQIVARVLCPLLEYFIVGGRSIMVDWQTTSTDGM